MSTSARYWDINRLVKIFIEEKNFAEAEKTINQYLNPEAEKEIYMKLANAIKAASGKNQGEN
jgi:deoxyhypusine synthase